MKSGLHGEPVGVPIRMSAKPVERRFSWGHITSFGGGLQLNDYVGKFLKLAPFTPDPEHDPEQLRSVPMAFSGGSRTKQIPSNNRFSFTGRARVVSCAACPY